MAGLLPPTLVDGTVCASYVQTYKSFTDDKTGEVRPAGAYSVVWLVIGPDRRPLEIRKTPEPLPSQGDRFACYVEESFGRVTFVSPAAPAAANAKG